MPIALATVAADPPTLARDSVAQAVAEQFDLHGHFLQLVSERDQNFRLTTARSYRYVVKVTGTTESQIVSDFQIGALLHLEAAGIHSVPHVVHTRSGRNYGHILSDNGISHCLRVVTYVDGEPLKGKKLSVGTARDFGQRIAHLDLALSDFSHEGENQVLLWDMQRAGELLDLCDCITDADVRNNVKDILSDFEQRVLPEIKPLPHQVIHNDANAENVLVDSNGAISGIIDFGDMLRAPRIIECATAASYLRVGNSDPVLPIAAFVEGYQAINSLLVRELDVLFDLIRTRLSMTLTILHWRQAAREKSDPYRQKSLGEEQGALTLLARLGELGREGFRSEISSK